MKWSEFFSESGSLSMTRLQLFIVMFVTLGCLVYLTIVVGAEMAPYIVYTLLASIMGKTISKFAEGIKYNVQNKPGTRTEDK